MLCEQINQSVEYGNDVARDGSYGGYPTYLAMCQNRDAIGIASGIACNRTHICMASNKSQFSDFGLIQAKGER